MLELLISEKAQQSFTIFARVTFDFYLPRLKSNFHEFIPTERRRFVALPEKFTDIFQPPLHETKSRLHFEIVVGMGFERREALLIS
jgi:hypothetical protein